MSKYHENCTKEKANRAETHRGATQLTSKPLCDCQTCACKSCPDILKLLCISVTEHSCDFGSKVTKDTKQDSFTGQDLGQHQSLLDMLDPDKNCTCEIVARAVKSHVHMNVTMADKRDATNEAINSSFQDTAPKK